MYEQQSTNGPTTTHEKRRSSSSVPCNPVRAKYGLRKRMDPTLSPVIHDILPNDILAMIFEEHAKLEGRAPAIDGQVCHLWRQVVLDSPRAWSYLEFSHHELPDAEKLRSWLRRSGTAPLHVRANESFTRHALRDFYDLLSDYHTRIASLRMSICSSSFFPEQEFPRLRHLDISWYPYRFCLTKARWGPMPELRSLCVANADLYVMQLNDLPSLKVLILNYINCHSLSRLPQSLTTLMLMDTSFKHVISGPVDFPSLT